MTPSGHVVRGSLHVFGRPPLRDRLPALAAAATATVGATNVASVMTSELPARARALLALAPAGEVRLAHVLALPAGLALIGVGWPLLRGGSMKSLLKAVNAWSVTASRPPPTPSASSTPSRSRHSRR